MRAADVEVFEYASAREPEQGTCVGLFTASAFKTKQPKNMSQWLCETTADEVLFKSAATNTITRFKLESFLVDNTLPMPA